MYDQNARWCDLDNQPGMELAHVRMMSTGGERVKARNSDELKRYKKQGFFITRAVHRKKREASV